MKSINTVQLSMIVILLSFTVLAKAIEINGPARIVGTQGQVKVLSKMKSYAWFECNGELRAADTVMVSASDGLLTLFSTAGLTFSVSGRPKPASRGRLKTGHFEQKGLDYVEYCDSPRITGGSAWPTYSKWLRYKHLRSLTQISHLCPKIVKNIFFSDIGL